MAETILITVDEEAQSKAGSEARITVKEWPTISRPSSTSEAAYLLRILKPLGIVSGAEDESLET